MRDLNTQLKKFHVTFGQVLLCPPCLKEQASGFLLLSTAAKLQPDLVMFFSYIWQVAGCLMSYSEVQQSPAKFMSMPVLAALKQTEVSAVPHHSLLSGPAAPVTCIFLYVHTFLVFDFRLNLN